MRTEYVTTFKRQVTRIFAELGESKEPVQITEHGELWHSSLMLKITKTQKIAFKF
jgi:hypothetical protein